MSEEEVNKQENDTSNIEDKIKGSNSEFDFETIKVDEFQAVIDPYKKILILTHDNPDPDAIAAAFGLYRLLTEKFNKDVRIGHGGIIGRTENKLMILKLNIPLYSIQLIGDLSVFEGVILVDTQPEAKYHALLDSQDIIAVFDHHPIMATKPANYLAEIRPDVGSTSTLITFYLDMLDYKVEQDLATALFYGIKTDTLNFSRHTSKWDIDAHQMLFPIINYEFLHKIEKPALQREYYLDMVKALENADVFGNVVIVEMEEMLNPDMAPLIADLMLQYEFASWSIVYGIFESQVRIAVRCSDTAGNAAKLVKKIVSKRGSGGGHKEMAAAQIKFKHADKDVEYTVIRQIILETIFTELELPAHGSKLCRDKKKPQQGSTESFNK